MYKVYIHTYLHLYKGQATKFCQTYCKALMRIFCTTGLFIWVLVTGICSDLVSFFLIEQQMLHQILSISYDFKKFYRQVDYEDTQENAIFWQISFFLVTRNNHWYLGKSLSIIMSRNNAYLLQPSQIYLRFGSKWHKNCPSGEYWISVT